MKRLAVAALLLALSAASSLAASIPLLTGPAGSNPVHEPSALADLNTLINQLNPVFSGITLGPTSDHGNTLVGIGAGASLGPLENLVTAVGWNALASNTLNGTAESTAVGWSSQRFITTGSQNTTVGVNTLGNCKTCVHDILVGTDAMRNPLVGNFNIGIGVTTLINSGDSNDIAIGEQVLEGKSDLSSTGHDNIGIGVQAMMATGETTANSNIGIGTSVMPSITSALANVIIGHNAGFSIIAGLGDTGVGYQALILDAGNGVNTAFGYTAGKAIVNGNFNICLGPGACATTLASGSDNLMIGYNADTPSSATNHTIALFSEAGGQILGITGTDTASTSAALFAGTLNATGGYKSGASTGVSCTVNTPAHITVVNGIVTLCN